MSHLHQQLDNLYKQAQQRITIVIHLSPNLFYPSSYYNALKHKPVSLSMSETTNNTSLENLHMYTFYIDKFSEHSFHNSTSITFSISECIYEFYDKD